MGKKIAVIGDGGWGTALAILLNENGNNVSIWGKFPNYMEDMKRTRINSKFLPGVKIPEAIDLISGNDSDFSDMDAIIIAVPTQFIRATLSEIKVDIKKPILSVAKGLEEKRYKRPSEIIKEVLGKVDVAVLSGPTHAEEVSRGYPAIAVIASKNIATANFFQRLFNCERFRTYTNPDYIGVELGGALKNVIAIAAGICDGLGLGDNAKAALFSRGIIEMARLGQALGAKKQTFFGASGIGDLITTAYSEHGRNLFVGRQIGAGKKLAEVLSGMEQVAEGVWTAKAVRILSRKHKAKTPISDEVYGILFENKDPRKSVRDLMKRLPRSEAEDVL